MACLLFADLQVHIAAEFTVCVLHMLGACSLFSLLPQDLTGVA